MFSLIRSRFLAVTLLLALLLAGLVAGVWLGSGAARAAAQAGEKELSTSTEVRQADTLPLLKVLLNEVMPKPAAGQPAWVELRVADVTPTLYLPVIHRVAGASFNAHITNPQAPDAPLTASLAGWQVTNQTGNTYLLPANLPPLPAETYVLILFDGAGPGANDLDPSDQKIVLHTPAGLEDVFPDAVGQVALYTSGTPGPETIIDYLAWGGYQPDPADDAVQAGVWGIGQAASFENGFGDISAADLLEPDESLGRYPGAEGAGAAQWAPYPDGYTTPGEPNPLPPVTFATPQSGAQVGSEGASVSWRASAGADGYQFQFDDQPDFSSPMIDNFVEDPFFDLPDDLPDGEYFWRVNPRRYGHYASWTETLHLRLIDLLPILWSNEKTLAIDRVRQNKDSRMLGLDGTPEGDPTTDLPENAWDAPAPCTEPPCVDTTKYTHGSMYCVRASIRMMASFYGGSLSMDRISYYILQEWSGNTHPGTNDNTPDNDLGYARGMYYPDEEDEGISWALNSTIITPGGKPTFQQIKDFINADRPIMFRNPGHMMVINGYRETLLGEQFIHVLDPDQPPDFERWQAYDTQNIDGYWPGPVSGTARSDESSVWTDSDGDGIVDFDEAVRFALDPFDPDTDGDWVNDKRDMREYVFDAAGNYSKRSSDMDGDSLRKERDPDNDADGAPDGCEDTNYNGIFQVGLGETDNFSAASSQACVPQFAILYPLSVAPVNAGDPSDPGKILVQVSAAVPGGVDPGLSPADFNVQIGGSTAGVLAAYRSADTYFLVVSAPPQGAAGYYDLTVTLTGVDSDSEPGAVYYLPDNPDDQVIVLDRSGSMLTDDRIGAAKNAASAFVDFLNDGDAVGVASFATTASSDFSLDVIDSPTVRSDAITAINSLSASGATALGQGMQTGYGMLTADGDPAHDWSMVLLSDGWENVAPFWADIAGSITDTIVHTVALGDDADTTLLQSIAGAKHGEFFYVNIEPSAVALSAPELAAPDQSPPLAFPYLLPNRLADVYVSIGESSQGLQRLYEATGSASESIPPMVMEIPTGLPEAVFNLNWDTPQGTLQMFLNGPGGTPVSPDVVHTGPTHAHMRVLAPQPGSWTVTVRVSNPANEFHFALSGKSPVTLLAAVDQDVQAMSVGSPVRLMGILTDEAAIKDAEVYALVNGAGVPAPNLNTPTATMLVQLFDDGRHGDGMADDGVYANVLTGLSASGGYSVKVGALGTDNRGQPFLRYANTGFALGPRVAYLWDTDANTALDFRGLLLEEGWQVDMLPLDSVPAADLSAYEAILVGPDTGLHYDFYNPDAAGILAQTGLPILGIGDGGASLFESFDLNIGYGHTWYSSNNQVYAYNPGAVFWNLPYMISAANTPAALYPSPLRELGVYIPEILPGLVPIAREANNANHYPVALEEVRGRRFILWGYNAGPAAMTASGRQLLINLLANLP